MKSLVKQVTTYDEDTGEIISDVVSKGSANGRGWVIMYSAKTLELIQKCTGSTFKVFGFLACGQQFEERGVITTKKAVQEYLGMTKQTVLEAFKWLKEHHVINEVRHNGVSEFIVNPDYITVGRDKKKRSKVWVNSWQGQVVGSQPDPVRAIQSPKVAALPSSGRSIEIE